MIIKHVVFYLFILLRFGYYDFIREFFFYTSFYRPHTKPFDFLKNQSQDDDADGDADDDTIINSSDSESDSDSDEEVAFNSYTQFNYINHYLAVHSIKYNKLYYKRMKFDKFVF